MSRNIKKQKIGTVITDTEEISLQVLLSKKKEVVGTNAYESISFYEYFDKKIKYYYFYSWSMHELEVSDFYKTKTINVE